MGTEKLYIETLVCLFVQSFTIPGFSHPGANKKHRFNKWDLFQEPPEGQCGRKTKPRTK